MKKTIVVSLALLFTTIFNYSSGMSPGEPVKKDEPFYITNLVINANVSVVLVNNDQAALAVDGRNSLVKLVTLEKSDDTLVISSERNKDFKGSVIIYVPANRLRTIRINSKAHVSSLYALRIPQLDVIINGVCEFAISNIGEVNLTATENYFIEQNREVRRLPSSVLVNKKY